MKKIAVLGTGYVGLVTGTCLAEIGHTVRCIDVDKQKVDHLKAGHSPIHEPGLATLLKKNIAHQRLSFTTSHFEGLSDADAIFIAVGTPQAEDGTANLTYINQAAKDIAANMKEDAVIIVKSTVPVGTNQTIKEMIALWTDKRFSVVSNPEFLREGSAVNDMFFGDRIVIGSEEAEAGLFVEELYRPIKVPVLHTDWRSAEMIKYASNAFLATKISFINEISSLCEKLGSDIDQVAAGMGMDPRIGEQFLRAGIGFGGSCFPKDTKALIEIAKHAEHEFQLLKAVIDVNQNQHQWLIKKARNRWNSLAGKRVAILGLAFKPNTDDIRESPALYTVLQLIKEGAQVVAYDPVASDRAKEVLPITFAESVKQTLKDADLAMICTEWREFTELPLTTYEQQMNSAIIFDGRNCYRLEEIAKSHLEYHSVGRRSIYGSAKVQ